MPGAHHHSNFPCAFPFICEVLTDDPPGQRPRAVVLELFGNLVPIYTLAPVRFDGCHGPLNLPEFTSYLAQQQDIDFKTATPIEWLA